MSKLTRDWTVKPVLRDQIFRERRHDREIYVFLIRIVKLTTCGIDNLTDPLNPRCLYFQHAHFISIVGVGEERRT